jgi:hypothetical protein
MRNPAIILLAVLALSMIYGCTITKAYPETKHDTVYNVQKYDLDSDGATDLIVYDFYPVSVEGHSIRRQVSVAVHNTATYTSFNNLSDLQLVNMRAKLDTVSADAALAFEACASNAGLKKDCTDVSTCTALCKGAYKCNKLLTSYQDATPAAMVDFVNDRNRMDGIFLKVRDDAIKQRDADADGKDAYLGNMLGLVGAMADVYSNPMYNSPQMLLCTRGDFGASQLAASAAQIGSYEPEPASYTYFVTVWTSGEAGSGMELTDAVPARFLANADALTSNQLIKVAKNSSSYVITWDSAHTTASGNILVYRFKSLNAPDEVAAGFSSPSFVINKLDTRIFIVPDFLFNALYGVTGSFFIALGISLSLTLVILLILVNLVAIAYNLAWAEMNKLGVMAGLRRAIGKAEPRWKTDAIIGVVLLVIGYYVAAFVAPDPLAPNSLFGAIDYFTGLVLSITAAASLVSVGCMFIGLFLMYTAAENRLKIMVLERIYGVSIREEKDLFIARAASVKDKITELRQLVDSCSREEFDVSAEYDILASIAPERVDELAKKMTPESKKAIEKDLGDVESAIERLTERKKTADASWPQWEKHVGELLAEQEEVDISSLITVPASLRAWCLSRYAREHAAEGVVFEHDAVKKKKVTTNSLIAGMVGHGLLEGAVVIRKDELVAAHMAHGASTVPAVLSLKLRAYLRSLSKSLGHAELSSFAAVGDKLVFVIMRDDQLDSVLFIPREKFKDAVEEWKKKSKLLLE